MTIRFDCTSCKANYEIADDLAGKMIMCRVCKKRGKAQGAPSTTPSATAPAAEGKADATKLSRRNFLPIAGLVLASVGAIATGALLARQPWRRPPTEPEFGPGRRRKGPQPDKDKKDEKGATA